MFSRYPTTMIRSFARIAAVTGICLYSALAALGQGPPGTPVQASPIIEREVAASLRVVGSVRADREAVVASEVSGVIVELSVDEGTAVRQGDVMCRLDDTVARLLLDEARGRLASLRATLAELRNGTRPEELRWSEATALEAKAMLDKWAFERERVRRLDEQNRSNPKEVHDTEMEYSAAERRYAQAQARLDMARKGPRDEELDRAAADVAAQEAVVARRERDLAKTQVRAPFDGLVAAKRTEVGQWIEEGGAVCELVAVDTVRIRADVPEAAIPFASVGASATFEIEALQMSESGLISRVIPRANPAARTFPIEIDVPNPGARLLPGMFAWVNAPSGPPGKRLLVSKDAIVSSPRGKTIFVVRPGPAGQMALPVPVRTGLEVAGHVEVQGEGLAAGDLVVNRANERLFGPQPVVVQERPAPAAKAE
ncbi:MAG: efflux RND transporter periplasmic adaptor subunit [Phycisphaerae bacterium]|nr:efflux RND transporter periplasmic adaptor subunit [Phycisphaerae bacterium]